MKVGFVGAGAMGAPMVTRLLAAGHDVRALGRTDEKRSALTELGAAPVGELDEVAAASEVVVVCVFTDDQVRQVCLGSDGDAETDSKDSGGLISSMTPGSVLVLHTTGSPRTAQRLAELGAPRRIEVLDAPVSGGPHDIGAGRITLFVGGESAALERVRPVLAAYADPILHVGAVGAGQKVKLVNNTLFAAQLGLLTEGVRLASELGVSETALLAALPHGSAASRVLAGVAGRGSVAGFIEVAGGFVRKDVDVVRRVVAEFGGDLGVLNDLASTGLGTEKSPI
jgi:3-hydroxyisobutyrate dehydrogenase-like beta-hydroxyacid dehydrogenase